MLKEKNKKVLNIFPKTRKFNSEKIGLSDIWNGNEVPFALKSSLAFVYCFHLKTVNVFRRNGNEIAHESLCNFLKRNMDTQPRLSLSMIYDVCSAIKAYVRDIPNGLMVKKLVKEWHKISRLRNLEVIKKKLKSLIQKLPQANKNLLFHFLVLSSAIIDNQKENSMSSKSLSIVLLPSLFEKVVNVTNIKDLPNFVELLEIMILNAKTLIEQDQFQDIQNSFEEIGKTLIIQAPHDEEKLLEDAKRTEFASLDSGLNSTSFLDDKTSHSLSSSSQARVNYTENGNSTEDLLNESDCINTTLSSDRSEGNRLHKSNSICSISSSISSGSDINIMHPKLNPEDKCTKAHIMGHFSCVGMQAHNIKDCRPYSVYDSSTLNQTFWNNSGQCNQDYKPVYDRSTYNIASSIVKIDEVKEKDEPINEPKTSHFIQRKKPVNKKSSCSIAQIERRNKSALHSSSSTITITSPHRVSGRSSIDSCIHSTYSSDSSIDSISCNITKPRRHQNNNRIRHTVPIRPVEEDVPFYSCLHRTASVDKSNQNQQ